MKTKLVTIYDQDEIQIAQFSTSLNYPTHKIQNWADDYNSIQTQREEVRRAVVAVTVSSVGEQKIWLERKGND